MLTADLSATMQREFTAKQIQEKMSSMKADWATSNPSLPSPTGNLPKVPYPAHYDVMLEYWGSKVGYQRESLMSTDDVEQTTLDLESDATEDIDKDEPTQQQNKRQKKKSGKSHSEAIEAGFNAMK
ncbi:Aste57867_2459 [Aphanomyces stellatus]|uniref:Aste57867_2459 protein n=1 Tax=Aphanomyces stellatus TaxID=120398 RepID=A0A485K8C3_9STRA|nr:hypothetical protein As57867_002453 [Aphanomyces stellatus]VFT79659.1 Aste57867_2459 [Aphanomyces stellatus]